MCQSSCCGHLCKLQDTACACRTFLRSGRHDYIGRTARASRQPRSWLWHMRFNMAYEIQHGPNGPDVRFLDRSAVNRSSYVKAQQHFVSLTIRKDKINSAGMGPHVSYLPTRIPGLDISTGLELLRCSVEMQLPSGGFFLAAPPGVASLSACRSSNMAAVVKRSFAMALPNRADVQPPWSQDLFAAVT